jgi:hypothetical protein
MEGNWAKDHPGRIDQWSAPCNELTELLAEDTNPSVLEGVNRLPEEWTLCICACCDEAIEVHDPPLPQRSSLFDHWRRHEPPPLFGSDPLSFPPEERATGKEEIEQ